MFQGNYIQIFNGLTVGDQVITSSYDQLPHLKKVNLLPEEGHFQGIDLKASIYATTLAIISGIIFRLYPAISVAGLPAVEALRDS